MGDLSIKIGQFNTLVATRLTPQGLYLSPLFQDSPNFSSIKNFSSSSRDTKKEVLLPKKFLPSKIRLGESLEVFVYTDSLDRIVATTQTPKAKVGDVAFLEVRDICSFGCFLDIGLDKHILMPTKNPYRFKIGQKVGVFITLDKQRRWIARLGIKNYLLRASRINPYARLEARVFERTDLGFGCVVEGCYYGLLYAQPWMREFELFEVLPVCAHKLRMDGKLDLVLIVDAENIILEALLEKGFLNLDFDSSSSCIGKTLNLSKKAFKRGLTSLLQTKNVILDQGKIFLKRESI